MASGVVTKLRAYLVETIINFVQGWGQRRRRCHTVEMTPCVKEVFLEVRAIGTELSQEKTFSDGGSFHSMLEKIPYWLCHEAFMNEALSTLCLQNDHLQQDVEATCCIHEHSAKMAMQFVSLRLVRTPVLTQSYQTKDVQTMDSKCLLCTHE